MFVVVGGSVGEEGMVEWFLWFECWFLKCMICYDDVVMVIIFVEV